MSTTKEELRAQVGKLRQAAANKPGKVRNMVEDLSKDLEVSLCFASPRMVAKAYRARFFVLEQATR